MQKKADIYHKDQIPPLARRKSSRKAPPIAPDKLPGERRIGNSRFAETTNDRVPFDGFHQDGPMPRPRRRRRSKSGKSENKSGMFIAIGLCTILLAYGALWVTFELYWNKKHPVAADKPPAETAEVVKAAAPAPLEVNVYQLLQDVRRTEGLMDGASRLAQEEDYEGAIKQLNQALENLPHHLKTQMLLARNHYMNKAYDPAIVALHAVLSEDPDNLPARLLLGQALGKSRRFTEAIEIADWALKADPYLTDAHILAAMSYKAIGQVPNSIAHLRKAFNMKSDDAFIGNELALAYAETGHFNRALEVFDGLKAQARVDSVTYFNLATCYAQKQMPAEVVATLLEAGERFGMNYITSWIRSEKFDPVRSDPDFAELFTAGNTQIPVAYPTSG